MAAIIDMNQQVGWPLEVQADLCSAPPFPPLQEWVAHIREHINPKLYQTLVAHKVPWSIINHIVLCPHGVSVHEAWLALVAMA